MKTSPRGIDDLVLSEGLRLKAYRDSGGIWTVGVGHTSAAGPPQVVGGLTITEAEAKEILARDLAKFEARVNKIFPNVPQHVFDGAVSFDFNTGAINTASWPTHYKAGRLDSAERALKLWNKVKGTVVPGLTKRRAHEADLIFRGRTNAIKGQKLTRAMLEGMDIGALKKVEVSGARDVATEIKDLEQRTERQIAILEHLFRGRTVPGLGTCLDRADTDDSGEVDLSDAVGLLLHLFQGGPAPAIPFEERGRDPTVDPFFCYPGG